MEELFAGMDAAGEVGERAVAGGKTAATVRADAEHVAARVEGPGAFFAGGWVGSG